MIIRRSTELDVPPPDVFDVIGDPDNDPLWCPTVSSSEQVVGTGPAPGAVYHQLHKPGPAAPTRLVVEVLEVDAPHDMRLRSTDDLAVFDVRYELEPLPGGRTRLTQIDDTDFRGAAKLLQPIMFLAIHSGIRRQFRELGQLLVDRTADHGATTDDAAETRSD